MESSAVASVGYDQALGVLELEFASGEVYRYFGVSAAVHAALMQAPSKGAFINRQVRTGYAFARL